MSVCVGEHVTDQRRAIYDLVWSKPMTQVAAELGISALIPGSRFGDSNHVAVANHNGANALVWHDAEAPGAPINVRGRE